MRGFQIGDRDGARAGVAARARARRAGARGGAPRGGRCRRRRRRRCRRGWQAWRQRGGAHDGGGPRGAGPAARGAAAAPRRHERGWILFGTVSRTRLLGKALRFLDLEVESVLQPRPDVGPSPVVPGNAADLESVLGAIGRGDVVKLCLKREDFEDPDEFPAHRSALKPKDGIYVSVIGVDASPPQSSVTAAAAAKLLPKDGARDAVSAVDADAAAPPPPPSSQTKTTPKGDEMPPAPSVAAGAAAAEDSAAARKSRRPGPAAASSRLRGGGGGGGAAVDEADLEDAAAPAAAAPPDADLERDDEEEEKKEEEEEARRPTKPRRKRRAADVEEEDEGERSADATDAVDDRSGGKLSGGLEDGDPDAGDGASCCADAASTASAPGAMRLRVCHWHLLKRDPGEGAAIRKGKRPRWETESVAESPPSDVLCRNWIYSGQCAQHLLQPQPSGTPLSGGTGSDIEEERLGAHVSAGANPTSVSPPAKGLPSAVSAPAAPPAAAARRKYACPFRHFVRDKEEEERVNRLRRNHMRMMSQGAAELSIYNDGHSIMEFRERSKRSALFARWLLETFGIANLASGGGVLDIAGGKGQNCFQLVEQSACSSLRTTVIDPVARRTLVPKRHRRRIVKLQCKVPTFRHIPFDEAFVATEDGQRLVSEASCLIGMHPDQATGSIVRMAIKFKKPFAVVPCCVFAQQFSERKTPSGKRVESLNEFTEWLLAHHPNMKVDFLPFSGRNKVLYMLPHHFITAKLTE